MFLVLLSVRDGDSYRPLFFNSSGGMNAASWLCFVLFRVFPCLQNYKMKKKSKCFIVAGPGETKGCVWNGVFCWWKDMDAWIVAG